MISFGDRPTYVRGSLPLLRVGSGVRAEFVVFSESWLWVSTHFRGRAFICPGSHCLWCDGTGGRPHCYSVIGISHGDRVVPGLLECSLRSFDTLSGLCLLEGLKIEPGLRVCASRRKAKSPLRLEPMRTGERVLKGFGGLDCLASAVSTIFSVPGPPSPFSIDGWRRVVGSAAVAAQQAAQD